MYQLTEQQIEYILNDIRRNGVETEDLQLNLLDHICCIVEQELKGNDDFERFYEQTIKRFYKKDLREIEDETINLLTFKNYYAMKKLMIVSGAYSAIAFIIGSFFKIMHWPGTIIFLFSAMLVFSLVFLPLLFVLKIKEVNDAKDKVILATGTVAGILYSLSVLFLVMHWPQKQMLWFITLGFSFFVFLPVFFFNGIRRPETKVNTIVASVLLMGFLGLQFTLTALRPSMQTTTSIYTYLGSERLLAHAQKNVKPVDDKLVQNMQQICEEMKKLILQREIGMASIPADFESEHIKVPEKDLADFLSNGAGKDLFKDLNEKVYFYNSSKGNDPSRKIPVEHSMLDPVFMRKGFCSSFYVLNNLTQLQLFLLNADNGLIAAK